MHFSDYQIALARSFKAGGVPWTPRPGHYVLDPHEIVERESPFQDRVYFVLNLPHFIKLAGGIDSFIQKLIWLPTWDQAREILRQCGMDDAQQQEYLTEKDSINQGSELTDLYDLIAQHFPANPK